MQQTGYDPNKDRIIPSGPPTLRHDIYGFFGVLYSTSFCNGFQTVS